MNNTVAPAEQEENNATPDHEGNQSEVLDTQLKNIEKTLPRRVLSEADWEQWITWGYVVIPNAIPAAHVERLKALLWEFQDMDPDDPSTWNVGDRRAHEMEELSGNGMVEIYNHQYLWDTRQTPRVYNAFVDIWDREDLWVSIDRANLNTPDPDADTSDGFIHWDVDTSEDPLPINVQGVLALTEAGPEVGGFQCVPEIFHNLEEWIASQPEDRDPFHPDLGDLDPTHVPMEAGDLVIFNSLLPHGIRPNTSDERVRMAQYVSMYPADEGNEEARERRIHSWKNQEHPKGVAFPGDPREWEKKHYERAELTELGERLLGRRSWNE